MKMRHFSIFISILVFLSCNCFAQQISESPEVIIDVSQRVGPMPNLLGTNIIWSDSNQSRKEFLSTFSNSLVRIWIYNWSIKPDGSGYGFDDELVRMIKNAGCEPIVCIIQVPRWLSTNKFEKGNNADGLAFSTLAAPTDYEKWGKIIYNIVYHYNVAKKLNV